MTFGQGLNRRADGVTTHRKTLVRAGVAAVVALGALVVAPPPAYADGVTVQVDKLADFAPGQTQPLNITLTPKDTKTGSSVTVSLSGLSNFTADKPSGCSGSGSPCTVKFNPGDTAPKSVTFNLTATGNVDPGQSKTDRGVVTASSGLLSSDTATFAATLKSSQPTQAPTVTQLTGTVKDSTTGSPVKNAVVMLVDGGACAAGKPACQTGTDNQGAFKFAASAGKPITPGTLQIGAMKNGYENLVRTVDAQAGQSVTVTLALKPTAGASASASPCCSYSRASVCSS
jgi:hypothetical protein